MEKIRRCLPVSNSQIVIDLSAMIRNVSISSTIEPLNYRSVSLCSNVSVYVFFFNIHV